jgi:hypothetical protein
MGILRRRGADETLAAITGEDGRPEIVSGQQR